MQATILTLKNISKSFPGVHALKNIDLFIKTGQVHAIVGENGAGKSTLMKIIAGVNQPDAGTIEINGQVYNALSHEKSREMGISIIFQELVVLPNLSVAENIFLGKEPRTALGFIKFDKMIRDTEALLKSIGLAVDPRIQVSELSIAQQQMVEIIRALSFRTKILIMDEPTSSLSISETEKLFEIIRRLRREGAAIIYVSHRLEEVLDLADEITVLRDGEKVVSMNAADVTKEIIIRHIVGRDLEAFQREERTRVPDKTVIEIQELSSPNVFSDITFECKAGEIVTIYGLVGAGRTELAEAIFGARPISNGDIRLNGKNVKIRSPYDALRLGIGLVPEDRKQHGLILNMAVRENISLPALNKLSNYGFIDRAAEMSVFFAHKEKLGIITPTSEQKVKNLSGGNQQKVVLAKWLNVNPKVLILDEPTRGIDVAAKAEIYNLIRKLAGQGVAIITISSELAEILNLGDRILVMRDGRLTANMANTNLTQEDIFQYATV